CSRCSGTRLSSGPSATTSRPSAASANSDPLTAGRQLRVMATASTTVKASTASTKEARKAALSVEAIVVRLGMPDRDDCASAPAEQALDIFELQLHIGGPPVIALSRVGCRFHLAQE